MLLLKYKERFIKFVFCSILLVVIMLVLSKVLKVNTKTTLNSDIITSTIKYVDNMTDIDVEYPRFNNDKVNNLITDNLYSYIKNFKTYDVKKSLKIRYDLFYIGDFVNIEYTIEDTINNNKYNNMLINLKKGELAYISSLFDEDYLKNEIYNTVNYKYSNKIYEQVVNDTINNFTYIISEDKLDVYFNNIYDNPSITINYSLNNHSNDNNIHKHKYIIFTYDDGPSEYTNELLEILNNYNSSATFFMSGSKMKYYDDIVLEVYNSKSEIGSHGYSHINLSNASSDVIESEINSTNIIFNEITHDKIKLYRPAYGGYNEYMDNLKLDIINWDIDTKDWLVRDSNIIYNNVIKNACDGCIVLMHDTYKETIEATEKLIPELNQLGYEVVSVSNYTEKVK